MLFSPGVTSENSDPHCWFLLPHAIEVALTLQWCFSFRAGETSERDGAVNAP